MTAVVDQGWLDRVVTERLQRDRAGRPSQAEVDELSAALAAAEERVSVLLRERAVLIEAAAAGFREPALAVPFVDLDQLVVDDQDVVAGAAAAVAVVAERHPVLLRPGVEVPMNREETGDASGG